MINNINQIGHQQERRGAARANHKSRRMSEAQMTKGGAVSQGVGRGHRHSRYEDCGRWDSETALQEEVEGAETGGETPWS